jgi:hypothetical protein
MTLKALAVATIALGLVSCGQHTEIAQYREPRDGWAVSYPASMTPQAIGYAKGMLWARGVVIASSPQVRATQELYFKRFPPDAAAFGLVRFFGGPATEEGAESALPLERAGFRRVQGAPPPAPLVQAINVNGSTWHVFVWFGPNASDRDKEQIWRIVRSIRFQQLS